MEITERLDNIEKLLNEAKTKIDRALADCPPFLKMQNRPSLAFYHSNSKGTGCAVKMTLHPATVNASGITTDGCIKLTAANQMTVGNRLGPNPTLPKFDWENTIKVRLDFSDLCLMLQVFRGETESVNDENGIYKRTIAGSKVIKLYHIIDPISGYMLELYETRNGGEERRAHFLMKPAEALGICEAIAESMCLITFGVPTLMLHE